MQSTNGPDSLAVRVRRAWELFFGLEVMTTDQLIGDSNE